MDLVAAAGAGAAAEADGVNTDDLSRAGVPFVVAAAALRPLSSAALAEPAADRSFALPTVSAGSGTAAPAGFRGVLIHSGGCRSHGVAGRGGVRVSFRSSL